MKSLAVRGVVLLVIVFAFAAPAFASPPSEMSETTVVVDLMAGGPGIVAGDWDGTLSHSFTEERANRAYFVGCVGDRCGEFEMLLVLQWAEYPWAPGLEGKWAILEGKGDLENLHGQGTFVVDLEFPILTMTLNGQYHFDPDQGL